MFKQIASVAAFATIAMAESVNFAEPLIDLEAIALAEEIGLAPMARNAFIHYGLDL